VIRPDLFLPHRFAGNAHVHCSGNGVDVDRCVRGARYRNVSGGVENRFNLECRATHLDPVEQFTCPWHGDGGEHAQNAERYRDFGDGERVSHPHISFPLLGPLDSIW
jgi:hypothetical protein